MNVLKIMVDELPYSCDICWFLGFSNNDCFRVENYFCEGNNTIDSNKITNPYQGRPQWCPLVVEVPEVCEYVGKYGGYDKHGDMIFFSRKTGCSHEHYQKIIVPDYQFCPNCGKPIKYIESE